MIVRDENKNEYILEKVAGTGGQGAVFFVENDSKIVIKAITNSDGSIIQNKNRYKVYRDTVINVISKANYNNLASPICMLENPYCGYVMRFMEGMEKIENSMMPGKEKLAEFYSKTGGIKKRYYVLREIARVLNNLYINGLVYADISPKNIYISKKVEDYEAWLIDVDNLHYQDDENMCIGTPMYRAPEVFVGGCNTLKSDVYDALKRGLARSSVAANTTGALLEGKAKAETETTADYETKQADIDAKISELGVKKQKAMDEFNIAYTAKLTEEINELKAEREKLKTEAVKYNNSLAEKENKEKITKAKTESELYTEELNQRTAKEKLSDDTAEKEQRYQRIYTVLRDKLLTMSAAEAKTEITKNPIYSQYLSSAYYYKLFDEFGR